MSDEDGTPSFAEVVKAFTPPGTDFEEFRRSLHAPGAPARISPEVVAMLNQNQSALVPPVIAQSGTTCARCDHPHGGPPGPACLDAERHLGRSPLRRVPDLQLDAISGPGQAEREASAPPPVTPGQIAAIAANEMVRDLEAGGFSHDDALTIIARMIAAQGQA